MGEREAQVGVASLILSGLAPIMADAGQRGLAIGCLVASLLCFLGLFFAAWRRQ